MHNTLQRPNGDWTGSVTVPNGVWLTGIDLNLFQSINGDLGGTWAPSKVIIMGGAGVTVSGALNATNCFLLGITGEVFINNAAKIEFQSGSTCLFDSGAGCSFYSATWSSGSSLVASLGSVINLTFSGASAIIQAAGSLFSFGGNSNFGGATTFASATWPLLETRGIVRSVPIFLDWGTVVSTHANPTHSSDQICAFNTVAGVRMDATATIADAFRIIIPPGSCVSDGNTLLTVTILYANIGALVAAARFTVVAVDVNGIETVIGSDQFSTLASGPSYAVTVPVNAVIDLTSYVYKIFIQCPTGSGGSYIVIVDAVATSSVTQKRT